MIQSLVASNSSSPQHHVVFMLVNQIIKVSWFPFFVKWKFDEQYIYFLFASAVLKSADVKGKRTWMRCIRKYIYVSICRCWRFTIIDCLENKSWKLFLPKLFKFQICNLNLHCGFMLKLLCKIKIMFRNTLFLYKLLPN